MTAETKKLLIPQIGAVLTLAVASVILFASPRLFRSESSLAPLAFITAQQTNQGDTLRLCGSFRQNVTQGETVWLYAEDAAIEITVGGV